MHLSVCFTSEQLFLNPSLAQVFYLCEKIIFANTGDISLSVFAKDGAREIRQWKEVVQVSECLRGASIGSDIYSLSVCACLYLSVPVCTCLCLPVFQRSCHFSFFCAFILVFLVPSRFYLSSILFLFISSYFYFLLLNTFPF